MWFLSLSFFNYINGPQLYMPQNFFMKIFWNIFYYNNVKCVYVILHLHWDNVFIPQFALHNSKPNKVLNRNTFYKNSTKISHSCSWNEEKTLFYLSHSLVWYLFFSARINVFWRKLPLRIIFCQMWIFN